MEQRLELSPGRRRVSSALAIALAATLVAVAAPDRVGGEPPTPTASGLVRLAPRAGADGSAPAPFTVELGPGGVSVRLPDGSVAWSWRLLAVEVGGEPVPGVEAGAVQPVEGAAGVVDYRRGAILERYLALEATVEQQFLIPEPLRPAGEDLVIAGRVESAGEFRETAGGWQWGEGRRTVRLGDVTVFDARGRELPARL